MDVLEAKSFRPAGTRHPWETARLKIIRFLLARYVTHDPHHILEVGSGDAFIIDNLIDDFPAAHFSAVDTAYEEPATLPRTRNADLNFYSSLDSMHLSSAPADVVLLPDVVEHVRDDGELISSIMRSSISHSHAVYLVTVPAFNFLFSHHDKRLGHHRRYTRLKLVQLCRSSNLRVIRSGYFFFSLFVLRGFAVIMDKFGVRTRHGVESWKGGRFFSAVLSRLLWIDFRIGFFLAAAGIYIPGLSCYCICRRLQ